MDKNDNNNNNGNVVDMHTKSIVDSAMEVSNGILLWKIRVRNEEEPIEVRGKVAALDMLAIIDENHIPVILLPWDEVLRVERIYET